MTSEWWTCCFGDTCTLVRSLTQLIVLWSSWGRLVMSVDSWNTVAANKPSILRLTVASTPKAVNPVYGTAVHAHAQGLTCTCTCIFKSLVTCTCTMESRKYTPLFYMLALGKQGRGHIRGIEYFCVTTITDRWSPRIWVCNLCTFADCLMDKTGEKRWSKLWYDTNSVLTIAIIFTGSSIQIARFHSQSGRGAYSWDKHTCAGLKMGGGLIRKGRHNRGTLRYMYTYNT